MKYCPYLWQVNNESSVSNPRPLHIVFDGRAIMPRLSQTPISLNAHKAFPPDGRRFTLGYFDAMIYYTDIK